VASVVSSNWVDNVASPFRAAHAGLKPGATAEALSRHFLDTTLVEWVKEFQAGEACEVPIAGGEDRPVLDG
jgi:hypothetical protein